MELPQRRNGQGVNQGTSETLGGAMQMRAVLVVFRRCVSRFLIPTTLLDENVPRCRPLSAAMAINSTSLLGDRPLSLFALSVCPEAEVRLSIFAAAEFVDSPVRITTCSLAVASTVYYILNRGTECR